MFHWPDLGAAVFEKLEEFGDHDVERPVQSIAIQQLGRILADLLQRSKWTLNNRENQKESLKNPKKHKYVIITTLTLQEPDLASVIILWVEQITELRQQFWPGLQLSFRGYGCDQDTFMTDNK